MFTADVDVDEEIEQQEQVCLNCGQCTGGASECPNCGAVLFNEDDPQNLQEDAGDLSDFEDE